MVEIVLIVLIVVIYLLIVFLQGYHIKIMRLNETTNENIKGVNKKAGFRPNMHQTGSFRNNFKARVLKCYSRKSLLKDMVVHDSKNRQVQSYPTSYPSLFCDS